MPVYHSMMLYSTREQLIDGLLFLSSASHHPTKHDDKNHNNQAKYKGVSDQDACRCPCWKLTPPGSGLGRCLLCRWSRFCDNRRIESCNDKVRISTNCDDID